MWVIYLLVCLSCGDTFRPIGVPGAADPYATETKIECLELMARTKEAANSERKQLDSVACVNSTTGERILLQD